jgi:hypothetical protein
VLGAGAAAPIALAASAASASPACPQPVQSKVEGPVRTARWDRTLAALRRAEARVAAFKAAEALLPPERRAYPASEPLEEEFARLDALRTAAIRHLLRLPAPHLSALTLKLDLVVADQAWELTGCESCLAAAAADAWRLAGGPRLSAGSRGRRSPPAASRLWERWPLPRGRC